MQILVKLIMLLVLIITLLVWPVVGLVFWLPLLLRATTIFSAALLPAALTHRDVNRLHAGLQDASEFYFRGFKYAIDAFNDQPSAPAPSFPTFRVFIEVLWTLVFWFITLFVISPAIRGVASRLLSTLQRWSA